MRSLGRLFNLGTSATTANGRVSMVRGSAISIVLVGATSGDATIQEHNAASGGTSQNLPAITEYWRQNNGVWTKVTQAAAATFTAGTGGLAVAEIDAARLSDGFTHVSASHASGTLLYVVSGLLDGRSPELLAAVGG